MKMADPVPQFSHLLHGLKPLRLAYVHMFRLYDKDMPEQDSIEKIDFAINIMADETPVLIAGGFTADSAKRAINDEYADKNVLVVFGRHFISNPDLVFRIKNRLELTHYDRSSFYTELSPKGYIDYPFSAEFEHERKRGVDKL